MHNKKADALGLTTLLVAIAAGGVGLGKLLQFFPLSWGLRDGQVEGLGNLLQLLLFGGAITLVVAWLAVNAVLEGQRALKAELEQQRAELSALRATLNELPSTEQSHEALPPSGVPEIEFR